jgi:sec-independent protein translocase protein TatA
MMPAFFLPIGLMAFWSPGPVEMLILAAVALLLYGGDLPHVARSWGKSFSEFRRGLSGIQNELNDVIYGEPERLEYHQETSSPYVADVDTTDTEVTEVEVTDTRESDYDISDSEVPDSGVSDYEGSDYETTDYGTSDPDGSEQNLTAPDGLETGEGLETGVGDGIAGVTESENIAVTESPNPEENTSPFPTLPTDQ